MIHQFSIMGEKRGSSGVVYTNLEREDGKVRRAGFGMFHELDCLRRLRKIVEKGRWEMAEDFQDDYGSWEQCFDYLRQMALCNADDTAETSEIHDGKWLIGRFGNERQCKDPAWLYSVTDCGEGGCQGKPFHVGSELEDLKLTEALAVEEELK